MEQTSHASALTAAELTALRNHVQHSLIAHAKMLLKTLQLMELPKTAQEVSRHASALLAVSRAFDRLVPEADMEESDPPASADTPDNAPIFRNRQQRRKAEAKARKSASAVTRQPLPRGPLPPGNGSA